MGKPAARIGDMHICPMITPGVPPVPHVGGPILGGVATVLIGGVPAAVMGDTCTCTGPPDAILIGSMGVLIGGKPAARMGDQCAHGGTISIGMATVLIGEMGGGAGGASVMSEEVVDAVEQVMSEMPPETAKKAQQVVTLLKACIHGTPFCAVCEEKKHHQQQ